MARFRRSFIKTLDAINFPAGQMLLVNPHASYNMNILRMNQNWSVSTGMRNAGDYMMKGRFSEGHLGGAVGRLSLLSTFVENQHCDYTQTTSFSPRASQISSLLKNTGHFRQATVPFCATNVFMYRSYSSSFSNKENGVRGEISNSVSKGEPSFPNPDADGNEVLDAPNQTLRPVSDAIANAGKMAREAYDQYIPTIQQMIDSEPYLKNFIVPVGGTLSATLLAWMVLPRLLRKIHKYSVQSPLSLLLGSSPEDRISYDKSLWSALEDPARYLITFVAFSQLAAMIVPTVSPYLSQAWRGAAVLSFVWFLHRWKENVIDRALASQTFVGLDQDKLIALDKISSVGLLAVGAMAFAEACGIAAQSILTVGGIGGVATAFASKDIFGNVLNGLALQFSKPFSIGDNIKAGSIEGRVVEMGLTTTSLINAEKCPVMVPNSLFSSQIIVNKSRAQCRAVATKVPIHINNLEKIPLVSEDIKSMLRSYPKLFLDRDAPYCYLSRIENSFAELTIGCDLIGMRKEELYCTEQDILLQAVKIIKKHGVELGSTQSDLNHH